VQAFTLPGDRECRPDNDLGRRGDSNLEIDNFDRGAGEHAVPRVQLQTHFIEAGLGRRTKLAFGTVLQPVIVRIGSVFGVGGDNCHIITRSQTLTFPAHRKRGANQGLCRAEDLGGGLLRRDGRENGVDIARAVQRQTGLGLREVVLRRRMDRHDIVAERQIRDEGVRGAGLHHVERSIRYLPDHLAGQKRKLQWRCWPLPDGLVADLLASEICGEGETP